MRSVCNRVGVVCGPCAGRVCPPHVPRLPPSALPPSSPQPSALSPQPPVLSPPHTHAPSHYCSPLRATPPPPPAPPPPAPGRWPPQSPPSWLQQQACRPGANGMRKGSMATKARSHIGSRRLAARPSPTRLPRARQAAPPRPATHTARAPARHSHSQGPTTPSRYATTRRSSGWGVRSLSSYK